MQLQFKIQLATIKPAVWRRIMVPAHFSFDKFHWVIQAAFGWHGYHLYQFSPQGYASYPTIGIPSDDYDEESEDSKKLKLSKIFAIPGQKFVYNYDFGDDWVHKITLESLLEFKSTKAALIAGKGACPPEDCGGPPGYLNLLEIINSPQHPERPELLEWLGLGEGESWNSTFFDVAYAHNRVIKVK